MSSAKRRLMALSQQVSLFRARRFKTPKFGQLTYFTSLRDIVKIVKIHRLCSWDVRGWCSDKKQRDFPRFGSFQKKKNQHRTFHLDPQRLRQIIMIKIWLLLIV